MVAVVATALPCPRRIRCRHPGRCLHTRSRTRSPILSLGHTPSLVRIHIQDRAPGHNRGRIHTLCRLLHHRHLLRRPTEMTGTTRGPPPP